MVLALFYVVAIRPRFEYDQIRATKSVHFPAKNKTIFAKPKIHLLLAPYIIGVEKESVIYC
jgi:hypothetical protein